MGDQASEGAISPFLRRCRLKAAVPHLSGKVLDIGCGAGALAHHVSPSLYCGVDIDAESIAVARKELPGHRFLCQSAPPINEEFDTVAALAVIEHVESPEYFLRTIRSVLGKKTAGRIILTTPSPRTQTIQAFGVYWGLLSRHAHQEHKGLLGHDDIVRVAGVSGFGVVFYQRFLAGFNQLIVLERVS